MDWILRRLRRRGRARSGLVCYLRENGPIAYAVDVFGADPRGRADAMLSTGLGWYWKTSAAHERAREWTELTRWSLAALLADLAVERDGVKPDVLLIGIDGQDAPSEFGDARVAGWIRAFGAAAPGPLHAVVIRSSPDGDLVFVAQQPPESIRTLLQAWAIDRDRAERRAYARLRGQSLEDVARTLRSSGVGS